MHYAICIMQGVFLCHTLRTAKILCRTAFMHDDRMHCEQVDCIRIMGSTGVGKSAILSSSEGKSLGISRNQLDSVTHSISAYRLDDSNNNTFYLVDTPGFNDQKLSEFRIVNMVREWMKANELDVVGRVLYLDKITDIRASGSKGRSLSMLKALTGEHTARNVSFVTIMWDQIWNEMQQKRAEERFQQLKAEHWKEYLEDGSQTFRFYNIQASAIDIINLATNNFVHDDFGFVKAIHEEQPYNETPFGLNLYCNLLERVEAIRQRLKGIEEELQMYSSQQQSQDNVEALTNGFRKEAEELQAELEGLEQDLKDFGSPPRDITREQGAV
ncbi:hypothetical protein BJ165DRAFT_150547 [Panaeolus papilionaceus]|nr:hypothetical protein BJ165DRAFT_150547 [Panaeolus papilionaceus]